MNAGQIIGQTLKQYCVEYFFGVTGGDLELWFGLRDAGIKYILAHNERSAVAMADAYSRITGKPSFAYGQFGVGAVVCVGAMADAYWGKSPVVCITSCLQSNALYRHGYQAIDNQLALFEAVTKWNAIVPNIMRLPDMLRTAIRNAVSGVPGPVHLDISNEFFDRSEMDLKNVDLYAEPDFMKYPSCRIMPSQQDIEKIITTVAKAKRPLILAGGGVIAAEAWIELVEFAERLNIPVVTSSAGKSCIATDHPLAVGCVGNYSRKVANDVAAKCDIYVVIGSNLGDHTTRLRQAPTNNAKIVHIDIDPRVLGTNYKEEISVVGDAKLVLTKMIEAAEVSGLFRKQCPWSRWVKEVRSMVASWRESFAEKTRQPGTDGTINPYLIMSTLNKVLGNDDIVVADTGYMSAYSSACVDVKAPGRKYVRASGSLGWGLPASLGVQCASKGKARVFCITGDGGIGYHISEIETAVRCNLPVIVILLNNNSLAFEYHAQSKFYKDVFPAANDFSNVDYSAVARAFGANGQKVKNVRDLEPSLRKAISSDRPTIIDISTDKEVSGPVFYFEHVEERHV